MEVFKGDQSNPPSSDPPSRPNARGSFGIGRSVLRVEDERLLRGGGRYVSDLIATSSALRVKVLRSPHAHARIGAIDASVARIMPGVVAVLTTVDLEGIKDLPCGWAAPGMDVKPLHPVLARDRVRYAGEPVAAVAAETVHAAEDALAQIKVSYVQLPAIADQEAAMQDVAPRLHDAIAGNVAYRFRRSGGNVGGAFAEGEVIMRRRFTNNRVTAAPLEGRAVMSDFDGQTGALRHHTSSQLPHAHARFLGHCLGLPLHKLHLLVPDIGGGFGAKLGFYPEDVLCALLSMRTGRACAWMEGRSESFLATTHGRDQIQYAELAAERSGRILGLRTRIIADIGAYAMGMGPGVPAINTGTSTTGQYDIQHAETEVIGVYTNRTPTGPYRGAGHPEASFLIERMVDELARELRLDPVGVRRLNFVRSSSMPHRLATGFTLDSGDYAANMDAALSLAGYAELRQQQKRLRDEGRYLGIGIATFSEGSGAAPSMSMSVVGFGRAGHESARVVVHDDGRTTVFCGTQSTGQGHSTSLAQIAAGVLGIALEDIEVVEGDTQVVPFGTGTFNSRSISIGGSAVYEACRRIMNKVRKIAAYKLRTRPADLIYENGIFHATTRAGPRASVARVGAKVQQKIVSAVFKRRSGFDLPITAQDVDRVGFAEIAMQAHTGQDLPFGMAPGLDETYIFDPKDLVFSYGSHLAVVEVDPETGHIALLRHVIVDDCGQIINPLLAEGQVHGGAAQGIGQALMEAVVHGSAGELLVSGFGKYAMPHATDLPAFETGRTDNRTRLNPLGARGVGEGSTIGATPAVVNAVLDALAPLGVTEIAIPMTPMRVWQAIERAKAEQTVRKSGGPNA